MAGRFVKLLEASDAEGIVALTGGLAADAGLLDAMRARGEAVGRASRVREPRGCGPRGRARRGALGPLQARTSSRRSKRGSLAGRSGGDERLDGRGHASSSRAGRAASGPRRRGCSATHGASVYVLDRAPPADDAGRVPRGRRDQAPRRSSGRSRARRPRRDGSTRSCAARASRGTAFSGSSRTRTGAQVLAVNLTGAFHCVRAAAAAHARGRRRRSIVLVASINGERGQVRAVELLRQQGRPRSGSRRPPRGSSAASGSG